MPIQSRPAAPSADQIADMASRGEDISRFSRIDSRW